MNKKTTKTCPVCGIKFDAADRLSPILPEQFEDAVIERIIFCSSTCKVRNENKKYYARNRKKIIERVKNQRNK